MPKAIDVHTHVFNLKYLPVAAILNHSGLIRLPRPLARAIAKVGLSLTKEDPTLDSDGSGEALAASAAGAEAEADAGTKEVEHARADFESFLDTKERDLPGWVEEDEDVRAVLAAPELFGAAPAGLAEGGTLRRLVAMAEAFLGNARQRMRWVFAVATQTERTIVRLMIDTYGDDVDVFVHHMMNMESFYRGGENVYQFHPRQVDRMRRLGEAHPGRLVTFTAWDPFRNDPDQLDLVKDAVDNRGAHGVKVYPPSGYRPRGNDAANRHPRVESPPPEEIDRRNLELFRWCALQGVPVFTHCTDEGFEAYEGAGRRNASPDHWRKLLSADGDLAKLKLCLGHAGGEGWFGTEEQFRTSFAGEVVRLCLDFPNVCCEFGILDHVRRPADFDVVRQRLSGIVHQRPEFAKKILYGSDWHMLFMHEGHEDFLRHYRRLFEEQPLAEHKERFFRGNAEVYLSRSG